MFGWFLTTLTVLMLTTARPEVSARSVKSGSCAAIETEATKRKSTVRERIAYFMRNLHCFEEKAKASAVPDGA